MKMCVAVIFSIFLLCAVKNGVLCTLGEVEALTYFARYGYVPESFKQSGQLMDEQSFVKAVKDFQSFAGLDVTGILDNATVELMSTPRCGVKDFLESGNKREKRYVLEGSMWKNKNLTYSIINYPKRLDPAVVDTEIKRAFDMWAEHTDLTFTPRKDQPNIKIEFSTGDHGDPDEFDGVGGTLAHAYFPKYGGDVHFDNTEHWTVNSYRGTNLFAVAVHEIGHSLGLSHSDVKNAVMAPFYRGYNPLYELNKDDIDAIQVLYGKKKKISVIDSQDENIVIKPRFFDDESEQRICEDPKVDAIFNSVDDDTYVFKGDEYWTLTGVGINGPRRIQEDWPGLPGYLDAAVTHRNGKTFFFKGSKYWRFTGNTMDPDYPKEISIGFTGVPDDIDAAMIYSGNGKMYFFKGSKFWKFDPTRLPAVSLSYPKRISNWEGIPNNIDAAFQSNGFTYFVKKEGFYRFNDSLFAVDRATPAFPRSMAYWWFGCKNSLRGTLNIT